VSTQASDSPAVSKGPLQALWTKHYHLIRRLHSLSGIVPVGMFVIAHLFTNFQMAPAMVGKESSFQHEVEFIHGMPALLWIEIALWASIGFHAALGLVYTFTGKSNVKRYKYQDNFRYTMQRVTGMVALVFIFLHIATLRWRWDFFGWFTPFYADAIMPDGTRVLLAHATTAIALQYSWVVLLIYVVGVYASIFHWVNGLWTAAITWGLTISVASQKRWGYVCAGLGVALSVFAAGGIGGALAYKVTPEQKAAIEYKIANPNAEHGKVSPSVPQVTDGAAGSMN
jgi:succinate dehydrogenase / fumarate reductase, cytochrome b subunit